jgi:hypothetical protein
VGEVRSFYEYIFVAEGNHLFYSFINGIKGLYSERINLIDLGILLMFSYCFASMLLLTNMLRMMINNDEYSCDEI